MWSIICSYCQTCTRVHLVLVRAETSPFKSESEPSPSPLASESGLESKSRRTESSSPTGFQTRIVLANRVWGSGIGFAYFVTLKWDRRSCARSTFPRWMKYKKIASKKIVCPLSRRVEKSPWAHAILCGAQLRKPKVYI